MALLNCRVQYLNDIDPFSACTNFPEPSRPPTHAFNVNIPLIDQISAVHRLLKAPHNLNDCTLQLHKHNTESPGDYGNYLDLESTIDEQADDFDGFFQNKKNAVLMRTQLSVRVHAIIEKLLNSSGRDLRRALFSLKQIFQDDKDLVHEFVQNDGLACLIKVGSEADQNYQNYILRALGQVMLYVDGMNGVIAHTETIQWLYSLIGSRYRLVVKTALKLLLVFVEYTESNCLLLPNAINAVDSERLSKSWSHIMFLLNERDATDVELLIFAATLINKTLNGVPDQDTYYDVVDSLEEQGMEKVIQRYMSKQGTDLDLLQQFHIYEAVLKHEDGDDGGKPLPVNEAVRQIPRSRKSYPDDTDRRKSRRHSVGNVVTMPRPRRPLLRSSISTTPEEHNASLWKNRDENYNENNYKKSPSLSPVRVIGSTESDAGITNGITPALRRRREREARHRSFIKEQEENGEKQSSCSPTNFNEQSSVIHSVSSVANPMHENRLNNLRNGVENANNGNQNRLYQPHELAVKNQSNGQKEESVRNPLALSRSDTSKKSWMLSMMYQSKSQDEPQFAEAEVRSRDLYRSGSQNNDLYKSDSQGDVKFGNVRDIQVKLTQTAKEMISPTNDYGLSNDFNGLINRAKEGLARAGSQSEVRSQCPSGCPPSSEKKSESDQQWEQLMLTLNRPLLINDLDFTDLVDEDDIGVTSSSGVYGTTNGECPPPPPPPCESGVVPPPPPPRDINNIRRPTPFHGTNGNYEFSSGRQTSEFAPVSVPKNKKTIKLFWKEVRDDSIVNSDTKIEKIIWDEVKDVLVDVKKLEHLFENRAKDLVMKNRQDGGKKNIVTVLDAKRSNQINIGMTKLPPPRAVRTAVLKMDATVMNREGIERILTILPSDDETTRIQEAQMLNPDIPLGTAEQYLLTLSSISELWARLKLWAFKLDYEQMEKEIAEPLMDLKQGLAELKNNSTFRVILGTLRSIGNFLNGKEARGFQLDYLAKVPEVKDTVHKHSLLHHLCHMVMETFPESGDLYSELGTITRVSKVDFQELESNLNKLEAECKASWDYLKAVCKHDSSVNFKVRMTEFLTDVAERIVVMLIVHRRVINRFYKILAYFGIPTRAIKETKVNDFCKIISEFALEYRTTRERVLQQDEKKANHRERNKTRGKMIIDIPKFRTKEQQDDQELRKLLGNNVVSDSESEVGKKWGTLPGMKSRHKFGLRDSNNLGRGYMTLGRDSDIGMTDADDEIFESLVKTATAPPGIRNTPRERKRARQVDRKSLRRTLKNGISEEDRKFLAALEPVGVRKSIYQ